MTRPRTKGAIVVIQQQPSSRQIHVHATDTLAALREALARASTTPEDREDLLARRLVAAAEALNDGVTEVAVRLAGGFTTTQMQQVHATAEEFGRDDAELARELATGRPSINSAHRTR